MGKRSGVMGKRSGVGVKVNFRLIGVKVRSWGQGYYKNSPFLSS